jgi:hypothetical protein
MEYSPLSKIENLETNPTIFKFNALPGDLEVQVTEFF